MILQAERGFPAAAMMQLTTLGAYRLGWTGKITMAAIFYSPLYVIGFEPSTVMMAIAIVLFYQSWLHTTVIGKLGPLEGILNTPSSHRVHHAKNADYLDRNHGGVTMLFDRLFGTYVEEREDEPVQFGLVKPANSINPIRVALAEWINIFNDLRTYHVRHWFGLIFAPPGWKPNGEGITSSDLREQYRLQQGGNTTLTPSFIANTDRGAI